VDYTKNTADAARVADAIVLMAEWNLYRGLDLEKSISLMRGTVLFAGLLADLRNVYERCLMEAHGFLYSCVGR